MTALPSIEPLAPGTRPAEPGWYVLKEPDWIGIVQIGQDFGDGDLTVSSAGDEIWSRMSEEMGKGHSFIARIYPDRIGQE